MWYYWWVLKQGACVVHQALKKGMLPPITIMEAFHSLSVGDDTLRNVKEQLGIKAVKKGNHWYWSLPDGVYPEICVNLHHGAE